MARLLGATLLCATCFAAMAGAACQRVAIDLDNLACASGRCLTDYVCHPEDDLCVPAIRVGCTGNAICPTTTLTGDPCPSEGSFLPCGLGVTDCSLGCRTCEGGAWSACTPGGSTCAGTDRVTLAVASAGCDPGATDVAVLHLVATTTCSTTLTALTVHRHPASNTADTQLAAIRLYEDADTSGTLSAGDLALAGPVTMSGGVITFTGVALAVSAGTPAHVIVVTNATAPSYFAARVVDATRFSVSDPSIGKSLAETPLQGGAHALAGRVCTGAGVAEPTDLGVGSQGVATVIAIEGPGNPTWQDGAGDEAAWPPLGSDNGVQTADCDLATAGAVTRARTRDRGWSSVFLHIDTGVPLGLPLCDLSMRVYGTAYRPTVCEFELFADHAELYLYPYSGTGTVDAAALKVNPVSATAGPDTATTPPCATDYVDVALLGFYNAAGGTTNLEMRLMVEAAVGDINTDDGLRITSIPEIYVRAGP